MMLRNYLKVHPAADHAGLYQTYFHRHGSGCTTCLVHYA